MKQREIAQIKNGTSIDHISVVQALNVLRILKINQKIKDITVRVAMNVRSKKLGRKDIVMIEEKELNPRETNRIALIAPDATMNIIRDSEVAAKHKVKLPRVIEGIIKCQNPGCISNDDREPIISKFVTNQKKPLIFRCFYCEKIVPNIASAIII